MTLRRLAAVAAIVLVLFPLQGRAQSKLEFNGDIRARGEGFRFSEDETGSAKKARRFRLRYRLRLNGKATVNEYMSFAMRVGTGADDSRSGNVTLGGMVDYGPDAFGIRRAYMTLSPFKGGEFHEGRGELSFDFGRVPNPYIWKNGEDKMLWDSDINLAGVNVLFGHKLGEDADVFANGGYYTLQEVSGAKDPIMGGLQAGVTGKVASASAGVRGSWYRFDRLTADFIMRGVDGTDGSTPAAGNIQDGLTGDPMGGRMNVFEGQGFVGLFEQGDWPVTAFGGYSHNASAKASQALTDVKASPSAYNFGAQAGSKKKVVQVGASYYYIEANAFPSQFIDSDVLDGVTNRKGFTAFVAKNVATNTDFKFTALLSDAIETTPGYFGSDKDSERFRYQIDLSMKF